MKTATIGSAMIDIITIIADHDIERIAMTNADNSFLLLEQGRKIDAQNISTHIGGGAINAAVALARQGHDVAPVVKIGNDLEGKQVKALLEDEKLDDSKILITDKATTGRSIMIASHDRNASIFTMRGANCLITDEEITKEFFKDIALLHIAPMSNESANAFPIIAKRGRDAGAFTVANPGTRQITRKGQEFLKSASNLDLININRVEAETLLPLLLEETQGADTQTITPKSRPAAGLLTRGLIKDHIHCELADFMSRLQGLGARYVMLTDGTKGAYLATPEGLYHCPILKTEVKGTAGAGDSFTSTSGALLAQGTDPAKTLQLATINASSVVEYVDTHTGLLTTSELEKRLVQHQEDLQVEFWPWSKERRNH
ncbi:MAG: carbohydrate kinase family protein [Cohaesibacter sp.]|jgi:sugar/nucleoside kinase (ribokinase family)|nr:carbohydrate kinase family protein [Cohaesibacter sp.]